MPPHRKLAVSAQSAFHPPSQQRGSSEQTVKQHAASSQPGVPLSAQQSPSPGHAGGTQAEQTCSASAAQFASQTVSQHEASIEQTASQQVRSSQPGVPLFVQQSPLPGHPVPQSLGQERWATRAHPSSHWSVQHQ
jgi:hypothetical protein